MTKEYRTPQYNMAHRILKRMRTEYGKPWADIFINVQSIAYFIYADKSLPYFMVDCANIIKELYEQEIKNES